MIDDPTRQKLLKEIEKSGNVYLSCLKIGVDKSTFYRWKEQDKEFKKESTKAVRTGRENNSDVAEQALMLKVKEKNMDAIKYVLGHNSQRYKQNKSSNVVILHKKPPPEGEKKETDFTGLLWMQAKYRHFAGEQIKEKFGHKEMPLKPNGEPIKENEYWKYEQYIKDWFAQKDLEEKQRKELEANNSSETDLTPSNPSPDNPEK
jgi:leucyl aminopeptidase